MTVAGISVHAQRWTLAHIHWALVGSVNRLINKLRQCYEARLTSMLRGLRVGLK